MRQVRQGSVGTAGDERRSQGRSAGRDSDRQVLDVPARQADVGMRDSGIVGSLGSVAEGDGDGAIQLGGRMFWAVVRTLWAKARRWAILWWARRRRRRARRDMDRISIIRSGGGCRYQGRSRGGDGVLLADAMGMVRNGRLGGGLGEMMTLTCYDY
ncbi:hypothetical protein BD413DRAFT_598897 [Trametes elegans]|nr:hypothetical protein BD413DRAFT_598897 [Trametes elegans]